MTVQTTNSREEYAGNGVTVTFPIPFKFMSDDSIVVKVGPAENLVTLALNTDYTLTGAGQDSGGSLVLNVAPPLGEGVIVSRSTDMLQSRDYVQHDNFPAESHEEAIDKLTMLSQEQRRDVERTVQIHESESEVYTMPIKKPGYFPRWGDNGLENSEYSETEYMQNLDLIAAAKASVENSETNAATSAATALTKANEASASATGAANSLSTAQALIADAEANATAQIQSITDEGTRQVGLVTDKGTEAYDTLNSVVNQATIDANEAIAECNDAAARAQSLPVGQVISGMWETPPPGTLVLRKAKWPIATFPDLWADVLKNNMAVPKADYDTALANDGSVGVYGIDPDGVSFWTPHYHDIYVVPSHPGEVGYGPGDIKKSSLPDLQGVLGAGTNGGFGTNPVATGVFDVGEDRDTKVSFEAGTGKRVLFKASKYDAAYGADGDSKVRTQRVHLMFCVVAFQGVVPESMADMSSLLQKIEHIEDRAPNPNLLRNGSMNLWTRGDGPFEGDNKETADGWASAYDGTQNVRKRYGSTDFAYKQIEALCGHAPEFWLSKYVSAFGTYSAITQEFVNNIQVFDGQDLTLSFVTFTENISTVSAYIDIYDSNYQLVHSARFLEAPTDGLMKRVSGSVKLPDFSSLPTRPYMIKVAIYTLDSVGWHDIACVKLEKGTEVTKFVEPDLDDRAAEYFAVKKPDYSNYVSLPITVGLVQQASTDGFLSANVTGASNYITVHVCKADGTQVLQVIYIDTADYIGIQSMVPISKGEYFKVSTVSGSPTLMFIKAS